ncbi:MAG: iron-sulfur cluster assembly accessory protein [Candidatus Obscuribacterales bacterium]|nr:iron-sulfur cluster assembly accessory protein [Candidatus Obscuribacterales bacterium]
MTETTANTSVVNITEVAAQEVKKLLASEPGMTGLRVGVRGGGCSGFSYGLGFDTERDGDHTTEVHGVKVFIDPKSAIYLKGAIVDFEAGLEGKGFTIKNPQAKSSCGCGESFTV